MLMVTTYLLSRTLIAACPTLSSGLSNVECKIIALLRDSSLFCFVHLLYNTGSCLILSETIDPSNSTLSPLTDFSSPRFQTGDLTNPT